MLWLGWYCVLPKFGKLINASLKCGQRCLPFSPHATLFQNSHDAAFLHSLPQEGFYLYSLLRSKIYSLTITRKKDSCLKNVARTCKGVSQRLVQKSGWFEPWETPSWPEDTQGDLILWRWMWQPNIPDQSIQLNSRQRNLLFANMKEKLSLNGFTPHASARLEQTYRTVSLLYGNLNNKFTFFIFILDSSDTSPCSRMHTWKSIVGYIVAKKLNIYIADKTWNDTIS